MAKNRMGKIRALWSGMVEGLPKHGVALQRDRDSTELTIFRA